MTLADLNRQQEYLTRATGALIAEFKLKTPERLLVSYGFPKGRGGRSKAIGICHIEPVPKDYANVIFVHPMQWRTPVDVLHVLLHELLHTVCPKAGHRGEFAKLAKECGLNKPWTATTPGEECKARLDRIAEELGEFPKASFDLEARGKKGSRLRLWECPCGVKARVASDEFHAACGECGEAFERKETGK